MTNFTIFIAKDHYWIVNGSKTQVFSSLARGYVPVSDSRYVKWLESGNLPTRIESEASLLDVLAEQAPSCLPATTAGTDARKARLLKQLQATDVGSALMECLFNQENRLRVLERKVAISKADFLDEVSVKAML